MSKFSLITLVIFVIALIGGAVSFSLYRGSNSNAALPTITVWGTFPAEIFNRYLATVNNSQAVSLKVNYVEQSSETFSTNFVKALATGRGPDAILVPADMILPQVNKLTRIPYSALSQRAFMDTYIQEADLYLSGAGILAIPFSVDPLVMFWNRDVFNAAGIATYPRYWDEFTGTSLKPALPQKLTSKDQNGNVRKSAIAMGDFSNITHAREILGSLFLQLGNPVTVNDDNGYTVSTLRNRNSADPAPAITYFSQFVDPSNPNYSWNRGLPADKTSFLAGTLATYFGFASEIADLRNKNPNLNFDVAPLPQLRQGGQKSVYGKMYGFSIVAATAQADAAYQTIAILTSPDYISQLSALMYLPTVRRDIIAQGSDDPYISIFNDQALIAKTWLDADPAQSRAILGGIIQSITSGQKKIDDAIRDASDQYDVTLKQALE